MLITSISNNILAGSIQSLDLDDSTSKTLLSNPQSYLDSVSEEERLRVRNILNPAYRRGFRVIFLVGASLAAAAFVVAFFLMPQVELARPDDKMLQEEGRRAAEEKKSKAKKSEA